MMTIKSLKTMKNLRTQKIIRQQLQKQEFFDRLIEEIKQQFTPQEHQYLLNFIIPRRFKSKEYHKITNLSSEKIRLNFDQKQNAFPINEIKDEIFTYSKKVQSNRVNSESHQQRVSHSIQFSNRLKSKKNNFNYIFKGNQSQPTNQQSKIKSKCKYKIKFNKISMSETNHEPFRNAYSVKLYEQYSKKFQLSLISQENIKKIYSNDLIKNVLYEKFNSGRNTDFSQEFSDFQQRKTFNNTNSFLQQEKLQTEKMRNLTSFGFQRTKKQRRIPRKIHIRKY